MTPEQAAAIRRIAAATVDAINAAGTMGAPAGTVYAGLMAYGCTLAQFESLTDSLQTAGMITRAGDLLHATNKGREFARINQ